MKKLLSLIMVLVLTLAGVSFASEALTATAADQVFAGPQPRTFGTMLFEMELIPEVKEEMNAISKEDFIDLMINISQHKALFANYNPPATPSFIDVPKDNPHYKAIEFANALKLVSKDPEGKFGLGGQITMNEALKAVATNLGVKVNEMPATESITSYMYNKFYYDFTYFRNLEKAVTKGEAYAMAYKSISMFPQGIDKDLKTIIGLDTIKTEKDFRRDEYLGFIPHIVDLAHYSPVVKMQVPAEWTTKSAKAEEINKFNTEFMTLVAKVKAANLVDVELSEIKPYTNQNFVSFTSEGLYKYDDGTTVNEYEIIDQCTFMLPDTKDAPMFYEVISSEGMGGGEISLIGTYKATIDGKAHYVILFQESIFSPYQKAMGLVVIIPEANGKVTTYGDLSYGKGKGIKE